MANRERGEFDLVARHRSYTLRLTAEACCVLEDRTGQTLPTVIAGVNVGRATDIRWLFWAALQGRHARDVPSADDAGDLIDAMGGIGHVVSVLAEFMALNQDDSVTDGADGEATPDARPGSQWRRLYLDARCAGMEPGTFWTLSLRELWLELAAARQRQKQQRVRDLSLAWSVANLSRAQKLPALSTLLGRQERQRSAKPQTWQEMKAALMALTGVTDGKQGVDGSSRRRATKG